MRVLHLIDAASRQATGTCLAMLGESSRAIGADSSNVMLLGGRRLREAARAAGIENPISVGVPYGRAVLGLAGVSRATRGLPVPDVVHCWSVGALAVAAALFRNQPKLLTITAPLSARQVLLLRALALEKSGSLGFLPISSTLRHTLISRGVAPASAQVLRPGIDMSRVRHESRRALRESWGVQDASDWVIALLNDPPGACESALAAMTCVLIDDSVATKPVRPRVLVMPGQTHRLAAQRLLESLGKGVCLIQEARLDRPWQVLPGCDAALAIGPDAGGLSLLWAMAANVPIVGEATYAVSEIVEDRHSALLAKPDLTRALASRAVRLMNEPRLAWQLRDTARHEAYSFFSCKRYRESLVEVYRQAMVGQPIEVPPMEVTGGLRFAGRA